MTSNPISNGHEWTVDSIREALLAKRISARELTADFCRRIERRNAELNAYLTVCPERAYKQADYLDGLVAARKPLPSLAGLPLAVKDVLSTKGVVTTCGSRILEGYRPAFDATAIERLERAIAVGAFAIPTAIGVREELRARRQPPKSSSFTAAKAATREMPGDGPTAEQLASLGAVN